MEIDNKTRLKYKLYDKYGRCDYCGHRGNKAWSNDWKDCELENNVFIGEYYMINNYKNPLLTCSNWKRR